MKKYEDGYKELIIERRYDDSWGVVELEWEGGYGSGLTLAIFSTRREAREYIKKIGKVSTNNSIKRKYLKC